MRLMMQTAFVEANGEELVINESFAENLGGWVSADTARAELLKRHRHFSPVSYKNGLEYTDYRGYIHRVWCEA